MEMWGRWCQFDDDSAFRVRVVGISGHGRGDLPGPGLAISDKGGLCRVFSPAAPIFVVQGTVVGTRYIVLFDNSSDGLVSQVADRLNDVATTRRRFHLSDR